LQYFFIKIINIQINDINFARILLPPTICQNSNSFAKILPKYQDTKILPILPKFYQPCQNSTNFAKIPSTEPK